MKHMKAIVFALITIGFFLTPVLAAESQPVAVITDLQGSVSLQKANEDKAKPIRHTTFLYRNDLLKTGPNGGATVFQLEAPVRKLGADQTLKIAPPSPAAHEAVRETALPADLFALMVKHMIEAIKSVEEKSQGVVRGPNEPIITALAPRHSLVLDGRPTFTWTPVDNVTRYKLTLYDAKEHPVWQAQPLPVSSHIVYPADNKPLVPGQYQWEIIVETPGGLGMNTAPFTVAGEQQASAIRQAVNRTTTLVTEENITNLAYLVVCLEYKLYAEAEALLQRAVNRKSEDADKDSTLLELLMRLQQLTQRWEDREKTRAIRAVATKAAM